MKPKMMKALIVASVASMIDQFNMNNIKLLQNNGYEVEVAANFIVGNTSSDEQLRLFKKKLNKQNIHFYQVNFDRNPLNVLQNYNAYCELKKILRHGCYSLIHCQSPIGGVLSRLATRKYKDTTIIYTAHGFHFYKGAPLLNWLIYYPIERIFAK